MLERAVIATVLLASTAWADPANVGPEMDALLDGMETLCGERYAGSLASRDSRHLYCIRAYSANCALSKGDSPRERQVLAHSCARASECPHCPGSEKSAARCVMEFKRYGSPSASARTTLNCERLLVDGMTHAGAPEADVQSVLMTDSGLMGRLPDCGSTRKAQKYRGYCMCVQRAEARTTITKQESTPTSRKAWEKEYQAALARAEAAGCDLVLTR